MERTDNAICDILSLGVDAELLGPPALVDALAQAVDRLFERYDRTRKLSAFALDTETLGSIE